MFLWLDLSQCHAEQHLHRQAGLDGGSAVAGLSTALSCRRRFPSHGGIDQIVSEGRCDEGGDYPVPAPPGIARALHWKWTRQRCRGALRNFETVVLVPSRVEARTQSGPRDRFAAAG